MLFLPILGYEDGYGLTYGARLTLPDPHWMGKRSRITFPLSWGGTKQAGVDLEKRIDGGVIDRVTAGASISQRDNLAYDQDDDRARLYVRGEHEFSRAAADGRHHRLAAGVVRRGRRSILRRSRATWWSTPASIRSCARNAVYGRASWEHLDFGDGPLATPSQPGGYTGYQGSASRTSLGGPRLSRHRRPGRAGRTHPARGLGPPAAAVPAAGARRPQHAARVSQRQLRRRYAGGDVGGNRPAADLAAEAGQARRQRVHRPRHRLCQGRTLQRSDARAGLRRPASGSRRRFSASTSRSRTDAAPARGSTSAAMSPSRKIDCPSRRLHAATT